MTSRFDPPPPSDSAPPQVDIYTDGGCDPNPGPGGWGAIICWADREWVLSGNDPATTNNRMELYAAAAALALLEGMFGRCQVRVYTDSLYLRKGIDQWISGWVSRGWRTRGNQAVKNQDLWRLLHRLTLAHKVSWHWVRGHSGHPLNERADRLATEARRALRRLAVPAGHQAGPPVPQMSRPRQELVDDGRPVAEIWVKALRHSARGPAGWGAVLRVGNQTRPLSGSAASTSANAMLLRGTTEALHTLTQPSRVTVYADADYLIKGASIWVQQWRVRGWRTRAGKPVANRSEWEALLKAADPHQVTWRQIQGDEAPEGLDWAGQLAAKAIN